MAQTRLRKYVEYLSGYAEPEDAEAIRRQLEDPHSEASEFFRTMSERLEDPFGLGRPLFPPGAVWEGSSEPREHDSAEDAQA